MVVRRNSDTSSKDLIRNGEENWERWVLRNHVIRDGIWAGTQSPAAAKDLSTKLWGKLTEMGVEKSCSQRWCSRSNSVISSKGSKKVYARKIHTSQNTKQNSQNTKTKTSHQTAERCLSLCLSLSSSCSSWRWWPSSYASVSTGCLGFVCDVISRSLWICFHDTKESASGVSAWAWKKEAIIITTQEAQMLWQRIFGGRRKRDPVQDLSSSDL